jgi:bifunctional DNA-binding transcriptional regulator/antitoxin component of YhaV-PrlF toxin-antitoxin module
MKITQISQGGQIQVPAEVRRRWGTRKVIIDDDGDSLRIRPLPDDLIAAAQALVAGKGKGLTSDEIRRITREEDAYVEDLKAKRLGWKR